MIQRTIRRVFWHADDADDADLRRFGVVVETPYYDVSTLCLSSSPEYAYSEGEYILINCLWDHISNSTDAYNSNYPYPPRQFEYLHYYNKYYNYPTYLLER